MTHFDTQIAQWYIINHRPLPWRTTKDPWHIWIAEVILQQTQVSQGINYYYRFIEKFPDAQSLASATEQEVLKLWEGLGYYTRARNLHSAAKDITTRLKGHIPETRTELLKLKGIGPYTASAIASIAFGEKCAVVDGNVYRLLSRYFAITVPVDTTKGKKLFEKLANRLMKETEPGLFNQAMMEMGALVCTPSRPNCHECPLSDSCKAYMAGNPKNYPVKIRRTHKKERYFNYLIITDSETTILTHRKKNDIWQGLYEFPLIETSALLSLKELKTIIKETLPEFSSDFEINGDAIHQLTHQTIRSRFFLLKQPKFPSFPDTFYGQKLLPINSKDLKSFPVPKLIENKFKRIF